MDRLLRLEGVENFRDFGGYAAAGGRRLKRGRLWRSAAPGRATDADLEAIAALDLALIVDLRRTGERTRMPSRRHPAFRGFELTSDHAEPPDDPWMTFVKGSDLSEASFRSYLLDYYRAAPFEPRHIELFAGYFRRLAAADGPVLIHCAAGKDRTGLLAALTHALFGVHPDDIVADYLLSNDPARLAARAEMVGDVIFAETGRRPTQSALMVAMGVDIDYLAAALAAVEEAHGGTEGYLRDVLGVDAALRADLEARVLD